MSLINDALRRADLEKQVKDAGGEAASPPPLPPEETAPPAPRRRTPWNVLLGATVVILVGAMAYGLWWGAGAVRETTGTAVEKANAALRQAALQSRTSVRRTRTAAGPAAPAAAADTSPSAGAPAPEPAGEKAEPTAVAADGQPAPSGTDDPASAGSGATASAGSADVDVPASAEFLNDGPLDLRLTPDTADLPAGADGTRVADLFSRMLSMVQAAAQTPPAAGQGEPAGTPPPAKPQAAPLAKRAHAPLPPVDTSGLKISSIMSGPSGGLAIINGRPVREGDSVAGAKVVRIRARTVEVEIDGRRATLGM